MPTSRRARRDLTETTDQAATFLLVDDDFVSILNMRRVLKKLKISNRTLAARDGQEALDTLTKGKPGDPAGHPIYIVLLDMNMPRMNGLEFLEAVNKDPSLQDHIIFAFEAAWAHQRAPLTRVSAFLNKDAPIETLSRAILSSACGPLLTRAPT